MARVITPEQALADGTTAASLRAVAAWKLERARTTAKGWTEGADYAGPDYEAAARHREDAEALMQVAQQVEHLASRKSRRRAATEAQSQGRAA